MFVVFAGGTRVLNTLTVEHNRIENVSFSSMIVCEVFVEDIKWGQLLCNEVAGLIWDFLQVYIYKYFITIALMGYSI